TMMRWARCRRTFFCAALLMGTAFPSGGPPGAAEPAEPRRLEWELSGEARFRPEWRDDADLDRDADDDRREAFMRIRLGLLLGIGESFKVFAQAQDARAAGDEASTTSNEKSLDLHQGYLEVKPSPEGGLSLILGRQEIKYGDERMIGAFAWNNVGRSFDAARVRWTRDRFIIDGLVARLTNRSAGAASGATTGSDLYGTYARLAPREGAEYEGYLLAYADNDDAEGETGLNGGTLVTAVGARVKERINWFDLAVEAAIESGEWRGDDLSALAAAAQAGGSWGRDWKARAFVGYDFATGDEDPADGSREEFFNFFPTNHLHYGYADYEGWRNIRSPYAGASLTRGNHFAQVRAHRFLLEEEAGPWKDAGGSVMGFDPAGLSGTSVGSEIDLTYRWRWRERMSLETGLSRFTPGRFARLTRGEDPSYWGYLMLTLGF
ncbi:MAG TPA: alginate export family protein, partial [Candidatus Polarisedimenticolia bacterium]|nr:alginate export family protein [Candidatus Polarisedimenticolia bacterium]